MNTIAKSQKATGFSEKALDYILVAICVVVLFIVAYPLYYVLIASVSNPYDVYAGKTFLLPSQFTLDGYKAVFADPGIVLGYWNSIKYTVIGTIFSVVVLYLTAYPLSVKELPGRKALSIFFIITMYFGGGLVPTYLIVKQTGLINNMWALFLPGGVAVGNMIIVRNFFENSIPGELYESARLDGCGNFAMLVRIVLPLSKAILAVLVLYYAVGIWNAYFDALIYLRDAGLHPLQIVLRNILLLGQTEQMGTNDVGMAEKIKMAEAVKYSAIVVSSIPMLLIYPFVQKYFVKGVMIGAVKG